MAKKQITLKDIVAAGENGLYTSPKVHEKLVTDGLVELNPAGPNDKGETLTRATQKGIESMSTATSNTAAASAPAAASSGFQIEDGIAIPSISGRGRTGATVYPFDKLAVNQSFFVPNSEDKPNAAKSLASTVSSANARYAVEIEGETKTDRKGNVVPATRQERQFVVRSVEENGVAGARIWRVL